MSEANHQNWAVVMIGIFRSDQLLSSTTISLAETWSKQKTVLYIDRPYSWKDFFTLRKTNDIKSKFYRFGFRKYLYRQQHTKHHSSYHVLLLPLTIPCSFLSDGLLYRLINSINNYIISKQILKALKHFNISNYIFFNSFLPSVPPDLLSNKSHPPLLHIYQTVDDISQEPYIARHGIREELEAFEKCNLGIATSTGLSKKYIDKINKKIEIVANAADFSLFENAKSKPYSKPQDISHINQPIILYTGHYSNLRFNHQLVVKLAQRLKHCCIVFVGSYITNDIEEHGLTKVDNIIFLGLKPIESLPAYIRHSEVAIIPYAKNKLTSNIYPLKINEYLAAGIPTVTTNFSEDIPAFAPEAYIADTDEEFIVMVETALNEDYRVKLEARMLKAKQNSWDKRIEQLNRLVEQYISSTHS